MQNRPRYQPPVSNTDRLLEAAGWGMLCGLWILVIFSYSHLPNSIPIHFNLKGEPDSYGEKLAIFILPVISTILFGGLTLLNRYPHLFNYPATINETNAPKHYGNAVRMLRVIKLAIVIIFFTVAKHTVAVATGQDNFWMSPWTFIISLALLLVPVFYFVVKSLIIKN